MNSRQTNALDAPAQDSSRFGWSEDWTATIIGLLVLGVALFGCFCTRPAEVDWAEADVRAKAIRQQESQFSSQDESELSEAERADVVKSRKKATLEKLGIVWDSPNRNWPAKIGSWNSNPTDAFRKKSSSSGKIEPIQWFPIVATWIVLSLVGAAAVSLLKQNVVGFLVAFPALFGLTILAYLLAGQEVIKYYNLEYPLWGILVGMLICNTIGTPVWLKPALQGELFIKIGLVLLGGEVLLSRLLALGIPGVCVSWIVTPVVLVSTYLFGQHILKMKSRSLNMVISADMSVCGVSAAIATGAACKAKKEELSLAIGISLAFTAIMMVVMPIVVQWMKLDPVVAGAWMGGTIDSTGAVVAAGETLGVVGSETAATVKMIQNILIGVVAFAVAVYWTRWVEPSENITSDAPPLESKIGLSEVWRRFPKFVFGFVAASILCSTILGYSLFGESWIQTATLKITTPLRGWLFCMAFVAIGLTTNFRELAPYLRTGKPLTLYVCGQTLNLLLSLIMAYWMFGIVFRH